MKIKEINTTFLFILSILSPYKFYIIGLLTVELVWAINSSVHPYIIKMIMDYLSHDNFNFSSTVIKPFVLFTILSIVQVFIFRVSDFLYAKMMPFVVKDTVLACFKRVNKLPYSYFKDAFGGSIASRIYETADSLEYILNMIIYRIISRILTFSIACFTVGFVVSKNLAILLLISFSILSIFNFYLARRPYELSKIHMESYMLLVGNLVDSISNILSIILFSRKKYEFKHINKKAKIEAKYRQKVQFSMLYLELGNAVFLIIMNLLCFIYTIYLYKQHIITVGDTTFILLIMVSITNVLRDIERDILKFLENSGRCVQTLNLLETSEIITDKKNASPLKIKYGNITFRDVTFGYIKDQLLFNKISLKISAGQKIVCIGHSGSGKSTFIDLILRLFPVNSGEILIDNQSINDVTRDSLCSSISLVPQDPILFNRTILENIIYGRNSSMEEVIAAAKKSLAHDFIVKLPYGYNTKVGERGEKLSGGQRKLIAITRIILKNNKILLFDELTSNLDITTKYRLKTNLKEFIQDKTIISITHSLEDVFEADRILLFDKGNIVADGKHEELIWYNQHYKLFFSTNSKLHELPAKELLLY